MPAVSARTMRPSRFALFLLALACLAMRDTAAAGGPSVLVEAEAFAAHGGWVLDQQFMDQMGSPYLLAHGLGRPVADAATTVTFPQPGAYRVWVRTRDWVAPWKMPGAPGKFQVAVNGKPLGTVFGTEGADWHWQDGGGVEVGPVATLALHDLTGFEGRCDAILFCADKEFHPPDDLATLTPWRRALLGLPAEPADGGSFDLVVVGGGMAGTCAALSAARLGLAVVLVQDRPVLGGNNSSEIRVWLNGGTGFPPYPKVGALVRELEPAARAKGNLDNTADKYDDQRRLDLVRKQPGLTLMTEWRVNDVRTTGGEPGAALSAVVAENTRTARRVIVRGRWFADCTGDGEIGARAGAGFDMTLQGHMGPSNLWYPQIDSGEGVRGPAEAFAADTGRPSPFPRCPWAVDLADKPFPGRTSPAGQGSRDGLSRLGVWFWESGFDRHPIDEAERVRDQNLRAMYGAWDALKNVDKLYPNHRLGWAAFIAGKRESRRLLGDVVVTGDDFRNKTVYPDACVPCTWHIDLHFADGRYAAANGNDPIFATNTDGKEYRYQTPYWIPYRALYSRDVPNLFMAGRDISVTHEALGPVRVMRTCGMMGEVVGMAASLCRQHDTTPRGVYEHHLPALKRLLEQGVGAAAPAPAR